MADGYHFPTSAERTHVPDLEGHAINQKPKDNGWADLKLYNYNSTPLYQWWGRKHLSNQHYEAIPSPCDEPFVIHPVTLPKQIGEGISESDAKLSMARFELWLKRNPSGGSDPIHPEDVRNVIAYVTYLKGETTVTSTPSFEEAWAKTGYQYGPCALESVKVGWRLATALIDDPAIAAPSKPWVIANAERDSYRGMDVLPIWVSDVKDALKFWDRKSAEDFCREDEDAWRVFQVGVEEEKPEPSEAAIAVGEHAFRAGFRARSSLGQTGFGIEQAEDQAWSDYEPPEDIKALL